MSRTSCLQSDSSDLRHHSGSVSCRPGPPRATLRVSSLIPRLAAGRAPPGPPLPPTLPGARPPSAADFLLLPSHIHKPNVCNSESTLFRINTHLELKFEPSYKP